MKIISVIIITIITLLCVYYIYSKPTADNTEYHANLPDDVITVSASIAEINSIPYIITTPSTFLARKKAEITTQISSTILSLLCEPGKEIEAGDTLVIMECALKRLELKEAREEYFEALNKFIIDLSMTEPEFAVELEEYLNVLYGSQIIFSVPESILKKKRMAIVRYDLNKLYNRVKKCEGAVNSCVITAPFSGIISDVKIFTGTYVTPGTILLTLMDMTDMILEIEIPEPDLNHFKPGMTFELPGEPEVKYMISYIHPAINPVTHSGKIIAFINNENRRYRHGQRIMVDLVKQVFKNRLVVPKKALLNRNDRDLVFVVKNGVAKWQYVKTGVSNNHVVEILKGVAVGDTVIVSGHYSLAHDVPVNVKMIMSEQ